MHAGYRPCKLCRPLETGPQHPGWVSDLLTRIERDPTTRLTDEGLRAIGVDPARARRYFNRRFGMTFHAYQRAWRLGNAMKRIGDGGRLTRIALESGFESESGFRAAFERLFGSTPGSARNAHPMARACGPAGSRRRWGR